MPAKKFTSEIDFWQPFKGWKKLCGEFYGQGISIESHDFVTKETMNWHHSFHPQSVEICMNLEGDFLIGKRGRFKGFASQSLVVYSTAHCPKIKAQRLPGRHRFITFEFSTPVLENFMEPEIAQTFWNNQIMESGAVRMQLPEETDWVIMNTSGPVNETFRKITLLSMAYILIKKLFQLLYENDAQDICSKHDMRIEKAKKYLIEHLDASLNLAKLSKVAGCSSFHLSRIFKSYEGVTISQFLTQQRINKAAKLLQEGSMNVTEVSMELGYTSLSHFSRTFSRVCGCSPYEFRSKPTKSKLL